MNFEKIINLVCEAALTEFNDKIVKGEKLEDYLNSLDNDKLARMVILPYYNNIEISLKYREYYVKNDKKSLINVIIKNIEYILNFYCRYFDKKDYKLLKEITKNNYIEIEIEKEKTAYVRTFASLNILNNFGIVKINYKDNIIKIYCPTKIQNILKKNIENKRIIDDSKKSERLYELCKNLLDIYGVIDVEALEKIVGDLYPEFKNCDFLEILEIKSLIKNESYVYCFPDVALFANCDIDDMDKAYEIYTSSDDKYKIYTKKEYKDFISIRYIKNTLEFKKLIAYMNNLIEMDLEYIDYFVDFFVRDFIYQSQLSIENACKAYHHNIRREFDVDILQANIITNMLKDIFNKYPKWKKKGKI